jgi:hypothetical protein
LAKTAVGRGAALSLANQFYSALIFSTVIKISLAAMIPLTGDEAYHYVWGKYLDFGYYDHPPLIGWLNHLFLYWGETKFLLRAPTIIFGIIIGLALYQLLKKTDKNKAQMIAILFWLSPFNLLNVIITNDAPLIFFTFLSGLFFFLGFEKRYFIYFLLSGLFLGLAFASKYFALLSAGAYLFYVLLLQRNRQGLAALGWVFLPMSFFLLLNVYWNYTHCWDNIVFNFFIRHNNPFKFTPLNFFVFILSQIYLITPMVVYFLLKNRKSIPENKRDHNLFVIHLIFYSMPILIFALISFVKSIGFHWTFSFIPFVFVLLFALFSKETLKKLIGPMVLFSVGHLIIIFLVLFLFHIGLFNNMDLYKSTIVSIKAREISSLLKPIQAGFCLTTESYDDASMLQFYSGQYVTMIGKGTQRGRQFDKLTDFIKLQGQNILIVTGGTSREDFYKQFFYRMEVKENRIGSYPVFFLLGYGFKYEIYKEKVLREILVSFYSIPSQLPCGDCYFKDHYFTGK